MDPYGIWGTGEQDRNFTYVGDIAEGMILATEKVTDASAVNIGTCRAYQDQGRRGDDLRYSWDGGPKRIAFDTRKPVGVFSRAADLPGYASGWAGNLRTSFREGLRRTIDWYCSTHDKQEVAAHLERLLTER